MVYDIINIKEEMFFKVLLNFLLVLIFEIGDGRMC